MNSIRYKWVSTLTALICTISISACSNSAPKFEGTLLFHNYTSYESWDGQLFTVDLASKKLLNLTAGWKSVKHTINGSFSRDGQYITFMGSQKEIEEWDVFVTHWDGNKWEEPVNLTGPNGKRDEDPKFSPTANKPIMVKIENAVDSTQPAIESTVNTSKTNDWETLVFDFTKSSAYTSSAAFHKISVFPEFGLNGASVSGLDYYIDDIKFLGGSKAANLTTAGRYASEQGEAWWWGGDYPDQIQSGYGFSKTETKQWGFGIFFKHGASGWDIANAATYKVGLGTNAECANVCKVSLVLVSAVNAECKATGVVTLTSADLITYSKSLSDFTVSGCSANTMTEFKKLKVAELHYQMLRADMQFTSKAADATLYPNGLGVAPGMKFE